MLRPCTSSNKEDRPKSGMFDFRSEFDSFKQSAKSSAQSGEGINDIRFVLTYGIGFITLMFLGFLSGFCLGFYGLEWDLQSSMILSLIVGISTLMIEATLLIIRLYRFEEAAKGKSQESQSVAMRLEAFSKAQKVAEASKDEVIELTTAGLAKGAGSKVLEADQVA